MPTKATLCLLLVCGSGFCTVPSISASMLLAQQEATPGSAYRVKGAADGRVQMPRLSAPMKLGEPNEIPLQLHGYKVHAAVATFHYYRDDGVLIPPDGSTELTVMYHPDGSAYVNITPEKLGKLQLHMAVFFEDGKVDAANLDTEVTLPNRKPAQLYLGASMDISKVSGTIYMGLSEAATRHA